MTTGHRPDYFEELVESAPDAILVVNQQGAIELVNRRAEALFGYERAELLGQPVEILVPDRAKGIHPSHRASYFADPRTRPMGAGLDLTARRKDGTEVPVDISLSPLQTDDGKAVSVAIRDVAERKRSEIALQETYRKLAASVRDLERHDRDMTLVNEMGDLLQSCLSAAEANDVIRRYAAQLFPSARGTVFSSVPATVVFEEAASWGGPNPSPPVIEREDCWALRRTRAYTVEGAEGGPACIHVQAVPEGGYVCVPMMAQGESFGLLHVLFDESADDGKTLESQRTLATTVAEHLSLALANLSLRETLRHQSVSDPLTGLYNRRYMQDYLTREIRRASRAARRVGVVVVDVDHFKDVNDRLGHGMGDEVLRAVARTLAANVREQDTVCRIGGDEFVVVLCDSPLAIAEQRAEQLREAVRALDLGPEDAGDILVTLSMGVAVFPDHGSTGDEVVRAADAAMYRAKERGRDAVVAASM